MDGINLDSDPTLTQASELLSRMEAAEKGGSPDATTTTTETTPASATAAAATNTAPAGSKGNETSDSPTPKLDQGAPATTDQTSSTTTTTDPKSKDAGQTTTDDPNKSKFAKNQERQQKTWAQINAEKEALAKEKEAIKREREDFAKAQQEFKDAQAKAAKPKYTAQQYADFAKTAEAEAERLEAAQEYEKADEKRVLAKKAREYAEELRRNPPQADPSEAQKTEQFKALQKEWHTKAAIDFPEATKPGTPENNRVLELVKAEPSVLNDPKGIYYAHRLAVAEHKAETLAASVPAKDKELGELRAKVKELEGKLTVPGDGAATNPGGDPGAPLSEEQQRAELYAMAKSMPN